MQCYFYAGHEATERARKRINHEQEPEYGPTKTKEDDKNWPICSTRFDYEGDTELCKTAKEDAGDCESQGEIAEKDANIGESKIDEAKDCVDKDIDEICHDAAKPVYGLNFMKLRPRMEGMKTGDKSWTNIRGANAEKDPPTPYHFRTYFKEDHRPYMRWWDTGKEAFQGKNAAKPDYFCDFGANDTYFGVGREFNSIHGRSAQICAYMGGGGIGDTGNGNTKCFKMQDWKKDHPDMAGTEWAELKMYQANCFRANGLNCLCQYEKIFKQESSEDAVLAALGTTIQTTSYTNIPGTNKTQETPVNISFPLGWRGYASSPKNGQQFPYLYGNTNGSVITGGLDLAQEGDVIIWPTGRGTLPRVGRITQVDNAQTYGGDIKKSVLAKANPIYNGSVIMVDKNNGLLPDICGNTSLLNQGEPRTLYKAAASGKPYDSLPPDIKDRITQQVSATYYCEDPMLGSCIEKDWDKLIIFRPTKEAVR